MSTGTTRVGVYPGSFDPVTYGHLDIVERAAKLFDWLYVAVLRNPRKNPCFSIEERVEMLRMATANLPNVVCESFDGLAAEYARSRGAQAIVRGLRAVSDFEAEFKMAAMNRHLEPDIETVFLVPAGQYTFVSSSVIREVAAFGGDVRALVPEFVHERLMERLTTRKGERPE